MSKKYSYNYFVRIEMSKGKEIFFDHSFVDHLTDLHLFDPYSEDHLVGL